MQMRGLAASKYMNDAAMYEQIGIAPYRRGEMRIGIKGQAEMPLVARLIHRLRQRAQYGHRQHGKVGTLMHCRKHLI